MNGVAVPLNEGVKLIGQSDNGSLALLDTQMAGTSEADAPPICSRAAAPITWIRTCRWARSLPTGTPSGVGDNTFVGTDATWKTSTFAGDKNLNLSAWGAHSAG